MMINKPKKKKVISRYTILIIIMTIIFTIITMKLVYIQLYMHEDYTEKANTTSMRFISEKAPRGEILDQNGNILATNIQTYALTYTTTDEAKKEFYKTMDIVFKILDDNKEKMQDKLKLKLNDKNEWYIDYDNVDKSLIRTEDLRFKKDRGFNEEIEKELGYLNENNTELTEEQSAEVDKELLKITPQEVYYKLVEQYKLIDLIIPSDASEDEIKEYEKLSGEEANKKILEKGYTYEQIRRYMVVLDELKMQSFQGYKSVTITNNINKDTAFILLQKLNDLPGIDVTLEPTRYYPYNNLASSVIGYLSPIDSSNKAKYELKGYNVSSDLIGVSGIESSFEEQLKGVTGGTTVKVNTKGRVTEELFKLESYPGSNVQLTIDKNIQYITEKSLQAVMDDLQKNTQYTTANRGAAVVVEAKTGRVLALASLPNYNPNDFAIAGKLSDEEKKKYFSPDLEKFGNEFIAKKGLSGITTVDNLFPKDSNGNRQDMYDLYPKPFYDYATQGLVPPGSTFKPMTSIAALESNAITPYTSIYDRHVFNEHKDVYGTGFAPSCLGYHGNVNVEKALEVSCNYFYYECAYRLYTQASSKVEGLNGIAKYAWRFGLGVDPNSEQRASTGIEITENFGQTYNFQSMKNQIVSTVGFGINDGVEKGEFRGYTFVPFDYSNKNDDTDELRKAKSSLKEKIANRIKLINPDEPSTMSGSDQFATEIVDDIKDIMNNSDSYKARVQEYKVNHDYDQENEAIKIANAISLYVVYDMGTQLTSAANEVNASIGQGINNFTPLQLAQYISTLVNYGKRYKLHIVDKILSADGQVLQEFKPEFLDSVELNPYNVEAVKKGMSKVYEGTEGTAAATFRDFPIPTAGKTGTADFKSEKQENYGRAPYAVYVGFAPYDDPELVIAGVIYDGGHGGSVAPVAKSVYEYYFKDEIKKAKPEYEFSEIVNNLPEDNKK